MKEKLETALSEKKINLSEEKIEQLLKFNSLLMQANEKFNLTRITDEDEIIRKHFLDSLISVDMLPENAKVVDIGAGGGFPSIPLKIARPDINLTMIDSVEKKVNFLNSVCANLNFGKAIAIHTRIEDFAQTDARESFDVCVARAVASLPTLLEYSLPLIKENGMLIAYKGSGVEEEINLSKNALKILNGQIERKIEYSVDEGHKNYLLIIKKNGRTPKLFPRRKNKPRKEPL
ncbi:MAG: 16S rRNA (guanine(527)-N(7))-methyltransferase RsmG [Christensenellales bacterium]